MRRIAFFALTAASLSACSIDSLGPSGSVAGTYSLRRINGSTLPYTFSSKAIPRPRPPVFRQRCESCHESRLISDDLTLYQDGTFVDVSRYDSGATSTDQGLYTSQNGSLTFESSESGLTYQGSVTDDVLTEEVNGYMQVFERR